jgi:hypothetical protein
MILLSRREEQDAQFFTVLELRACTHWEFHLALKDADGDRTADARNDLGII